MSAINIKFIFGLLSSTMAYNASASVPSPFASYSVPFSYLKDSSFTWLYTTLAIVLSLLVIEQLVWRRKKGVLPGDRWIIPIIGRFADSMHPTIEGYQKQWSRGELTATSVFNMSVHFIGVNRLSTNCPKFHRHSRKQRILP